MDFKLVLYTGTSCSKCPRAREVVREVAKELGWTEGKEFVEKLIDGENLKEEQDIELEGKKYHIVQNVSQITTQNVPCALAGEDYAIEALTLQVASVPSIVINGGPVFKGIVPEKEQLMEEIKKVF
ncbi:MAG: hypothetical protein ACE5J7_04385 [Candidatus Aenigmatarchaeota archaeon]